MGEIFLVIFQTCDAVYNWFISLLPPIVKENRIYISVEFKESLGMNFFSPFQSEREFKV